MIIFSYPALVNAYLQKTQGLKSCIHNRRTGSSPVHSTSKIKPFRDEWFFYYL